MTLSSPTQPTELSWLNTSSGFLQERNFLERQRAKVSSHNVSRDFFRSRWAYSPVHPSRLTGLTILKAPNPMG